MALMLVLVKSVFEGAKLRAGVINRDTGRDISLLGIRGARVLLLFSNGSCRNLGF